MDKYKINKEINNYYCETVHTQEQVLKRCCGVPTLAYIQNPNGHCFGQPAAVGPTFSSSLDKSPKLPSYISSSVILSAQLLITQTTGISNLIVFFFPVLWIVLNNPSLLLLFTRKSSQISHSKNN